MIKSELMRRIAGQNPHLYNKDVEKVVNAIFDEIEAAGWSEKIKDVREGLRVGDLGTLRTFNRLVRFTDVF